MCVGNFSRAQFLVMAECRQTEYIPARPFRVNAGPIHAYVLGPDNTTAYLSELSAGAQVLVVSVAPSQTSQHLNPYPNPNPNPNPNTLGANVITGRRSQGSGVCVSVQLG